MYTAEIDVRVCMKCCGQESGGGAEKSKSSSRSRSRGHETQGADPKQTGELRS